MTTNDLKAVIQAHKELIAGMQKENLDLRSALKYYSNPKNQKDIALVDRGMLARRVLEQ